MHDFTSGELLTPEKLKLLTQNAQIKTAYTAEDDKLYSAKYINKNMFELSDFISAMGKPDKEQALKKIADSSVISSKLDIYNYGYVLFGNSLLLNYGRLDIVEPNGSDEATFFSVDYGYQYKNAGYTALCGCISFDKFDFPRIVQKFPEKIIVKNNDEKSGRAIFYFAIGSGIKKIA